MNHRRHSHRHPIFRIRLIPRYTSDYIAILLGLLSGILIGFTTAFLQQ